MKILLLAWALAATCATIALSVFHFANPYPLVQIPDRGHRLFAAPDQKTHDLMVEVISRAGLKPYRTFKAGVHQTLLRDGFTVIAYGENFEKNAISLPVENPLLEARSGQSFLAQKGMTAIISIPSKELGEKLVLLQTSLAWDIVYRLPGRKMPMPQWEKKW